MPQPLDRVLQRLLLHRLFLPLAAALLGIFLVTGFFVWQSLLRQQESLTRSLALRVEDSNRAAEQILSVAAQETTYLDTAAAAEHLRLLAQSAPQFSALYVLDADRRALLVYPPGSSLPESAVGEPFTSPRSGLPALTLSVPAPNGGSVIGELSLQPLQEVVDHGVGSSGLRAQIEIRSPSGQVIVHSGSRSALRPTWLTQTSRAALATGGWSVTLQTSILDSLGGVFLGGLATLLAAAGLGVALVADFGRRLRRSVAQPLSALNQRASRLAEGDFTASVSFATVTTSFYEAAELAGTFERAHQAVLAHQTALQASEKRFRAMAELLPDMTFEINLRREVIFANRTVARMMGYTAKDVEAGISFDRFVFADDLTLLLGVLEEIQAGKSIRMLTCRLVRRTRQPFPAEMAFTAIRGESNEVSGFRCVARDITARVKAEESLRRAFQLFTEGPVVVFRVAGSSPRKMEFVSPNVSQFGYTAEDFIQSPGLFNELIHPNDQQRVAAESGAHREAGNRYFGQEYRIRCRDGAVRWVYAFNSIVLDELGFLTHQDWYILDISERRRDEERVRTQNQRLAALQTIGAFIENNADLGFTLQTIIGQLIEMLNVDAAAVLRLDPSGSELIYQVHDGFQLADPQRYRFQLGESFPGLVAQGRKAISLTVEPDALAADFKLPEMARERFTTYYGLPLIATGKLMGVLEIFQRSPLNLADSEWTDFLETLAGQAAIAIHNAALLENLQRANSQLTEALARALESRDEETEQHSQRLRILTEKMARRIGLDSTAVSFAGIGALLHDIGKIGVGDDILKKRGAFTPAERKIMQTHPHIAERLLGPIEYLRPALDIPLCHHERYDGKGYPKGLAGEAIPLAARIFTIADVWDALRFQRPYRDSWSFEKAARYLRSEKGKYFDPHLVDIFLEMVTEEEPVFKNT